MGAARAAERTRPGPQFVHEAIRSEGEKEPSRPSQALCWSLPAPVLVGNSLGGVALVAALNHAQVVAGSRAGA